MPVDPATVKNHPLEIAKRLTPKKLESLDPQKRAEAEDLLVELDSLMERNPLYKLRWDNEQQVQFFYADTPIQAAFCGNRFGKTTALVVKTLVNCVDTHLVPDWLLPARRWYPGDNTTRAGTAARVVVPTFDALHSVVIPAFREWVPKEALKGGKWDRAFNKQLALLQFENGSFVDFKTYQQDPQAMAGAALHMVGYDEPPPWETRRECRVRLTDFKGFEMFAMTPLNVNTSWVRREIWRKREHEDITVTKGSIWDNKMLDRKEIQRTLDAQTEVWRRAVEFGDFIDIGGLCYPDFDRHCVENPYDHGPHGGRPRRWTASYTNQSGNTGTSRVPESSIWEIVVGIDPGIRNAAFVWIGFDKDNKAFIFAEALLQNSTPVEYAELIKKVNKAWGISEARYIIDPAARQRAQVNADTIQTELMRQGIITIPGQNDVEAGISQVRQRLANDMLRINPACRGLRDEADDYALEPRDDGVIKPIKGHDHRMDAMRYAIMARAWNPLREMDEPRGQLGYEYGKYDPEVEGELLAVGAESGPLGEMA